MIDWDLFVRGDEMKGIAAKICVVCRAMAFDEAHQGMLDRENEGNDDYGEWDEWGGGRSQRRIRCAYDDY